MGLGAPILKNIFSGIFSPVIDGVVGLGKTAIDSKEKQNEFMHEVEKLKLKAQTDFTDWYYKDKQRASEMYATDNSLQKIYALTFLVGFILLSAYLVIVMAKLADLPDYAIALISGVLGSFTSKLNTITDFLFGSSQGSREKHDTINNILEEFNNKNKKQDEKNLE